MGFREKVVEEANKLARKSPEEISLDVEKEEIEKPERMKVSLRQNGVGTGFVMADAILPKGHERLTNSTNAHRGQKGDHYARPNQISQNKHAGRVAERHRPESVVRELVVNLGATPRGRWRHIADVARQRRHRPECSAGASSPPADANP